MATVRTGRKSGVPGKVQPRSALATRAKQSSRREQTGKRERVRDCHCSAEQVTAGQHQQRTGFQETELTEEEDARDEVIEDKRRLIDWKKGSDRRQRNFRERRGKEKNGDRYRDDRKRQTTLGPRRPPLWIRMADRMLKFGYFYLDDLKERLYRFKFDLKAEERSNINYIFRAAKSG